MREGHFLWGADGAFSAPQIGRLGVMGDDECRYSSRAAKRAATLRPPEGTDISFHDGDGGAVFLLWNARDSRSVSDQLSSASSPIRSCHRLSRDQELDGIRL